MLAKDIMSKDVITARKEMTVEEVAKLLIQHKISGVPVVDEYGYVIGMVTEGDLLVRNKKVNIPPYVNILGGIIYLDDYEKYDEELRKAMAIKVEDIMTEEVIMVFEDDDLEKVATLMWDNQIKRVPVIREGRLIGLISRADILCALIPGADNQEPTIDENFEPGVELGDDEPITE